MLLISNADSYIGYSLTSHLASYPHLKCQLRVLCQDDTQCKNFRNQGIDVRKTDYTNPHQLSLAMRKVSHLVLVVGNQVNRVTHARNLCRVASRSGVNSIILLSHVGALCPNLTSSLMDYALVEDEIYNTDCAWTILRLDWIQQYFHLWSTYTERHRTFPLPIDVNTEFCPIDIQDVCECVSALLLDGTTINNVEIVDVLNDQHVGQVYTLTGSQMLDGKRLIQSLINATKYSAYRYTQIRPMDLQYYLEFLQKDILFDARLKNDQSRVIWDDFTSNAYRLNIIKSPTRSGTASPLILMHGLTSLSLFF
ncbi:hypothetical protein BC941DRAFT_444804 [Chlamydoabsidia padenii]|nr:hypothetical protein BC941DRAFT_444804 [Chlamydoabsidia padenii]